MSTEQECPLRQQAVGWALHALEPDEEMAVLLHLPQCADCRRAVGETEQVLAGLGSAVEQVDPPTSLRDGLMSRVADTEQRPPVLTPRGVPDHEPPAPADRPARSHRLDAEDATAGPRGTSWSWLSSRGRMLVAAALVVAAVFSVGGLALRTSQLEQQRDAEIAQAQSLSDLISRLDEPGSRHAVLVDSTGATVAAVLVSGTSRQVYTVALPPNSSINIYVAWGINPGASPQPLGTFDVDAADHGLRTVGSVTEADSYEQYAISIEPGRDAPASPTQVVASGQVTV